MRISDILRSKGSDVMTVSPESTVADLVALLSERRFGAAVVSDDGETLRGIVSERDVVSALAQHGPGLLSLQVSEIMTEDVVTCRPDAQLVELLGVMTERRFRHVPVVVDSRMQGLVSIGDIVKFRLDELSQERDQLEAYIHT
ncbi:MAG: CBS domain-containing protein [Actinomycetales bacterium]